MPNILAVGLFPDRHQTLFNTLIERFNVISLENEMEALLGRGGAVPSVYDADAESRRLEADLGSWLTRADGATSLLSVSEKTSLRARVGTMLRTVDVFDAICRALPVDFVLSSADYASSRRPVVLEARHRGIPTACLEHGALALQPEPSAFLPGKKLDYFRFCSDYVIVDNALEHRLIEQIQAQAQGTRQAEIVSIGVPLDVTPCGEAASAEACRTMLELDPARFTLTIGGTWYDTALPALAVSNQLDDVRFYQDVLSAAARLQERCDLQVVVKFHPAFTGYGVVEEAEAYLRRLAARKGIGRFSVLTGYSPEFNRAVLGASDLLISPSYSSLLWDGFLLGVPAIIMPPPGLVRTCFRAERLKESSVPVREGCVRYAFESAELDAALDAMWEPAWREAYMARRAGIFRTYGLRLEDPKTKSLRVRDWIAGRIAKPSA